MAKNKKVNPITTMLQGIFDKKEQKKSWSKNDFEKIFQNHDPESFTFEQRKIFIASAIFVQNNITPEDYKNLYDIAAKNPVVNILPVDLLFNQNDNSEDDSSSVDDKFDDDWDITEGLTGSPIPDADKKSLLIRVQIRGVKKPPLWREVKIPANLNFENLHDVIQILFGWTNSHMWQFEKAPYSRGYRIAPPVPEDMDFGEDPTDIAHETPVTMVLKEKGDKMIYLYDFGDDWVHDITVKQVMDEQSEFPVCTAWKSDNPMEDCGGPWGYEDLREWADPKIKHSKKEWEEFFNDGWFESKEDFMAAMDDNKFDLTYVNQELENIKPN